MLRLVLLVSYLIASFSASPNATKHGSGADPWGLNPPPPPATETDAGGGADPLG